jgi:hypothetical protein
VGLDGSGEGKLTGASGQMHLGYHELRNMLKTFREEREKKKQGGVAGGGGAATGASREHRASRGDEYRERERSDRDRGHDRHSSSRYE